MRADQTWAELMTELMERLGTDATLEDAEAAYERAEDWYNATPKADILNWYRTYRLGNEHAPDISDPDEPGRLVEDWEFIVMFYRAASNG